MTAKTVTREELQKLLTTDADAFTALRFLRQREQMPTLAELEKAAEPKLPGVVGAFADIYHALWAESPAVREEVPTDRQFVAEILKGAMATSAYRELHAQTQYSELKSVLGTLTMGETIVQNVSKEDSQKLQESAEAQQAANEAKEEAEQAEAEASMMEGLAESSPALAAAAAEAKAKASAAQAKATSAQQVANAAAEALMGKPGSEEAAEKLQELARLGLSAAKKAQAQVEEVSKTLETWGFEEGELTRDGIPEAMGILKRIEKNKAFRDFAKLLGRLKRIAARKARSKEQAEGVRVTKQETGRDIKRAVPSELVALTHPALRQKALTRWSRGELRLRGEEAKQKLGEGPVVVCEDSSGSMDGAKQQWAKAVVLALAYYAKLRNRSFVWIMFDARVQRSKMYLRGRLSPKDLLEIAESRSGGGTEFQPPLEEALRYVREGGLKKADVAFVTDGDSYLEEQFLKEFGTTKESLEMNVLAVLCDAGHTSDATVKRFANEVLRASSFSEGEAQEVFNHL